METRGAEGREEKSGVWKWMIGNSLASKGVRERGSDEAKDMRIDCMLFADDTTVVGQKREMDESVRRVKEVMGRWEERNNEEVLEFGTKEGDEVRIFRSCMVEKEDVRNRMRRTGMLWGNVKGRLKGSRLAKRWQGWIVQACVESNLPHDCQARVWYKRDVNKLQRWMDKYNGYVWSDRNGEPLREMAERHENMTDVRHRLGI